MSPPPAVCSGQIACPHMVHVAWAGWEQYEQIPETDMMPRWGVAALEPGETLTRRVHPSHPAMGETRTLPVVDDPHPEKDHVVEAPDDGPLWEGRGQGARGDVSYACGDCGRVLVASVTERTTISRVHVRCTCGALNEVRVDPFDGAFDDGD